MLIQHTQTVLELNASPKLNCTWIADSARPATKVWTGKVGIKWEVSANIETTCINEIMLVPHIEKFRPNLEIHFFHNPCVFDNGKIGVGECRPSEICYT